MGKPVFTEEMRARNAAWNRGYSDAYQGFTAQVGQSDPYYTGYDVGKADRAEDEEAIASGDFDGLTEEERREVYGDERDRA